MVNVFAIPVFFISFRESLETAIIVSVLLGFLKQTIGPEKDPEVYKKLVKQVWLGTAVGLAIVIIIGAGMIGAFYGLKDNAWARSEAIWEGVFALLAAIIITLMGAALLRISKLQEKWRVKIARAIEAKDQRGARFGERTRHFCKKYAMFILPFVTVLREGVEAVVFIAGVGVGLPASSFPIAVFCGLLAGITVGFIIYKGGNRFALQIFLTISTCFLYLVAAGLFSKAVWSFELHRWNKTVSGDASETGSGPGSYDVRSSIWHVNCCNPKLHGGGGWGVFNSLFGWTNSATYGSVISYNVYWIAVILWFLAMGYNEKHDHWPFIKRRSVSDDSDAHTGLGSMPIAPEKIAETDYQAREVSP